ncbi:MAG: DUF4174 domain-containing protein [Myxococcota bacterium]
MISWLLGLVLFAEADPWDRWVESVRWRARIVFVLSDDPAFIRAQRQRWNGAEAGFEERHLQAIFIGPKGAGLDDAPLPRAVIKAHVEQGVTLMGKDGDFKAKSPRPVAIEWLFERIDAMPMRRREMRKPSAP